MLIFLTKLKSLKILFKLGAFYFLTFSAAHVIAQTTAWPTNTRLIVPLPAGGGVDLVARKLSEQVGAKLGTILVIDNKPGASGLIAAKAAASGSPDGSTIFYLHPGILTMQAITGRLDLLAEFKPVTRLSNGPQLLVVPANSPYKTQAELFQAIKAQPGKLNYGTGGNGSPTHLAVEWMDDRMIGGLKATQIPFKGSVEAVNALLSGEIDFTVALYSLVSEHMKKGKIRALSVTSSSRLALLPNIPTVAEAGLPGYVFDSWGGFVVPVKTPDAIVSKLFEAIKTSGNSPDFVSFIERIGGVVQTSTSPAAFAEQLKAAVAEEKRIVEKLGLKP